MKIKSFVICMAALLFVACNLDKKTYTIEWNLSSVAEAGMNIDSVNVVVGDCTLLSVKDIKDNIMVAEGEIDEPAIASLVLYASIDGEQQTANCDIILEPGKITIDNEFGCATGSTLNDAVLALYKDIIAESEKENVELDNVVTMLRDYIVKHKDDVSSVYVLNTSGMFTTLESSVVNELYNSLSDDMKKQPMAIEVIEKAKLKSMSEAGGMFIDFETEYEGKVTKLSDYVGKGKYVLVDFWASWCGPCRREIPNLIHVYNKYAGAELEVLGVASWDKPEDTKKAIAELGINYPQIINAQSAGTDAYSIDGIPEIILFAPDGKILKRGLREEAIEEAVKEALGK